jgi:hypothetical protein
MLAAHVTNLDLLPKAMPKDVGIMIDPLDAKGEFSHRKIGTPKGKLIKWLVACDKKEVAYDGKQNGLFTAAVIKNMLHTEGGVSYSHLAQKVIDTCTPHQTPQLKNMPKSKKFDDGETILTI